MHKSMKNSVMRSFKGCISLTVFLLCLSSVVNAQNRNFRLLKKAYKRDSQEMLLTFFQNWKEAIPPISQEEFAALNDTLKHAYSVFEAFYSPSVLAQLDSLPFFEYDTTSNFRVFQNQILVSMRDQVYFNDQELNSLLLSNIYRAYHIDETQLEEREEWKIQLEADRKGMMERYKSVYQPDLASNETFICGIRDFRPQIDPESSAVYLGVDYERGLRDFMREPENVGNLNKSRGRFRPLGEATNSQNDINEKKAFLENQIQISKCGWNHWAFNTDPVARLYFDRNFEYCMVRFWVCMKSGEAIMKRNGETWELISFKERTDN